MNMPKESDLTEFLAWFDAKLAPFNQALGDAEAKKDRADWMLETARADYVKAKNENAGPDVIFGLSKRCVELETERTACGVALIHAKLAHDAAQAWFTFGHYWGEKHKDDDTLDEEEING